MKLAGRNAIITGGSQGLGLEIAKYFLQEGANVALCGRHQESLASAKKFLQPFLSPSATLLTAQVDVSEPTQVERFIADTVHTLHSIDILVANAGIYGPKGLVEEIDWDEWSRAIDINLKGTVLPCRAVLPHMKSQQYGKIIILSGGGATKPMPHFSAYAASKAAVVRFAETLAEEVVADHIDVNAIAPGALNTRLLDELLAAGPEKVGARFYAEALKQQQTGGTSPEKGAQLSVFLASTESDGITGRLISAIWDNWQNFPQLVEQFKNSDIYTLRRIVPEDRGLTWDTPEETSK